jgi:hypothetical protein
VSRPDGDSDPEHVIVLRTQGAPQRGVLRGRSPRRTDSGEVEAVPTSRLTVVRAQPFGSDEEAERWLSDLRGDKGALEREASDAAAAVNRFLRAHRAAAADPWARDVSTEHSLVARVGYGDGDQVAEGRYASAYELPRKRPSSRRREDLAPAERLASIVGGREQQLACEELVLRARADIEAGRPREAALQARVALEATIAEVSEAGDLTGHRDSVAQAANAALDGDPEPQLQAAVEESVRDMEAVLRRRRLRSV